MWLNIIALGCLAFQLSAEPKAQLTWEGEVDGILFLYIQGKELKLEHKQGQPVARQKFKFFAALPDSRQHIRLEVRQGRGSVRITEQPGIENSYTAAVSIEDRQDGAGFYSIALYWDADRGSFANEPSRAVGRMDSVSWSGHVDGEVIIECGEEHCESKPQRGPAVTREKSKFSHPMPSDELRVFLDRTDGPAEFLVLEEPSARNDFHTKVKIRSMPGGGDCSFLLSWPRPRRKSP